MGTIQPMGWGPKRHRLTKDPEPGGSLGSGGTAFVQPKGEGMGSLLFISLPRLALPVLHPCACFFPPLQANRAISAIGFVTAAAGAFSLLGLLRSRSRERQY